MNKVTFLPKRPLKDQKPIIEFTSASLEDLKTRALALDWVLISVEPYLEFTNIVREGGIYKVYNSRETVGIIMQHIDDPSGWRVMAGDTRSGEVIFRGKTLTACKAFLTKSMEEAV